MCSNSEIARDPNKAEHICKVCAIQKYDNNIGWKWNITGIGWQCVNCWSFLYESLDDDEVICE